MLKLRANNRYLNLAETCYKTCNLLSVPNVFLFRKVGGTPLSKSKIQRMSPNFIHCMYLIFEPITTTWRKFLLRRKFWGIPLRRNLMNIGRDRLLILQGLAVKSCKILHNFTRFLQVSCKILQN